MGMCLNKRVLIGLGVVAVGIFAVSPRLLGSMAPLLILAACPLSMIFMMRAMSAQGGSCEAKPQASDADQPAVGLDAAAPAAPVSDRGHDLRELQEEVNALKAELQLRSQELSR